MTFATRRVCLLCLTLFTGCAGGSSGDSAADSGGTTAVSVGIAWDVTDAGISGYYVHYGTDSPHVAGSCAYAEHIYYSVASLGSASSPTALINGLTPGRTYYFSVSAYYDGLESACSNEISKTL